MDDFEQGVVPPLLPPNPLKFDASSTNDEFLG